jgi:hypothetical protein
VLYAVPSKDIASKKENSYSQSCFDGIDEPLGCSAVKQDGFAKLEPFAKLLALFFRSDEEALEEFR